MCDNRYNFAQPWTNNFYYHYLQQHTALMCHFQKLHSNIHDYGNQFYGRYNPADVYNHADCCCSSSSSSSCSSCSSRSCSETSSEYEEQEGVDSEEGNDEEQFEDEDDEDESDCEYEFNVDAILAMRAAKEELKKQEQAELKHDESKDDESSDSKDDESSDSKDERESKSDSIVLVDSDQDDFEFVDLSSTNNILDCNLYRRVGGFNKFEEEVNKKLIREYVYGSKSDKIAALEAKLNVIFERDSDYHQPPFWPVLPLRL